MTLHRSRARRPKPVLSRSVEDYLKAVYHLSRHGGVATTKDVAVRLALAAPSVSTMLKRLTTMGLVKRVPYQGAQLTREGRHAALKTRVGDALGFVGTPRPNHGDQARLGDPVHYGPLMHSVPRKRPSARFTC